MNERPRFVRCAIYTRKSSEEGLEQEFNSLDAQHDACSAYVASQKLEGWTTVPQRFDDGGYSGGTLQRPALATLLELIEAQQVDMVIVYKIDRLTRSLSDFGKLVELFEKSGCSFVSVTQSFNTSTPTGRLMLHILLSFAQFEREVTSERIRDKMAASARRGMWTGGIPPLGYHARDKKLVVDPAEAERVIRLFEMFVEDGCLNKTWRRANELGIRSRPTAKFPDGPVFRRSGILWLLSNPVYVGQTRHKGATYPGQHQPIIEQRTWGQVQTLVTEYLVQRKGRGPHAQRKATLIKKLFDESGSRLSPRFGGSASNRRRHYVSSVPIQSGSVTSSAWRVRADEVEGLVSSAVLRHLKAVAKDCGAGLGRIDRRWVPSLQSELEHLSKPDLLEIVDSVHLRQGLMEIALDPEKISRVLQLPDTDLSATVRISTPFPMRRAMHESRMVIGDRQPVVDRRLLKFIALADVWWWAVIAGKSIADIARQNQLSVRQVTLHLRAAFLAPDIVEAIVDGRQPKALTVERLRTSKLPTDWAEQRRMFDFEPPRTDRARNASAALRAGDTKL